VFHPYVASEHGMQVSRDVPRAEDVRSGEERFINEYSSLTEFQAEIPSQLYVGFDADRDENSIDFFPASVAQLNTDDSLSIC
jgi:hypothetical protein